MLITDTSTPRSFSARQIAAAVIPGLFIASMKSLYESSSSEFLILSSTDKCCFVDSTSVNLLIGFLPFVGVTQGPKEGKNQSPRSDERNNNTQVAKVWVGVYRVRSTTG